MTAAMHTVTTETKRVDLVCIINQNYEIKLSIKFDQAYGFQIPIGSTAVKHWNVYTFDNTHLGVVEEFENQTYKTHLYMGSSNIQYYQKRPVVDSLKQVVTDVVNHHYRDYRIQTMLLTETTKTVVEKELA
jgi:hypothetical protein